MTMQTSNETPSLEEVIRVGIESRLFDVHTSMPATVEQYDAARNVVDVQPVFKRKYTDGTTVNLPVINNVPVVLPRANQAAITFPIKKGDYVLLLFSERSIDTWKLKGGVTSPNDPRKFDLSDAVAIPGIYPQTSPVVVDPSNLVVRHGTGKITLKPDGGIEIRALAAVINMTADGKISIGNGVVDLLALLSDLITTISAMTVPTGVGPSGPPINVADFAKIAVKLGTIKA